MSIESLSHSQIDDMIRDIMPLLSSEEQQLFRQELEIISEDYITETKSVLHELQALSITS